MGGLQGVPAPQRVHECPIAQQLKRERLSIASRRGWGRGVIKMHLLSLALAAKR